MKAMHLVGPAPYFTNCFLLVTDAGHAVIVDPAAPAAQVKQLLEKENAQLTHILLTHGHYDHTYSLQALRSAWGAKLCMCAQDALGNEDYPATAPDVCFEDGDVLAVDELEFKVWRTPGHTPGSCCILCGELFFTGDTLFAQDIGRTDLQGGDPGQMQHSLKKLKTLPVPDEAQVLPGHEEFSTMGYERAHNPYLAAL